MGVSKIRVGVIGLGRSGREMMERLNDFSRRWDWQAQIQYMVETCGIREHIT